MTIAERRQKFEDRGFTRETASVLVLIEEALHTLFLKFPNAFVLFGGATLVLFYGSQRHSGDIDLLPNSEETPQPAEIIDAIAPTLHEVAQPLGLAPIKLTYLGKLGDVEKLQIDRDDNHVLFTIDIARFSAVIKSELVEEPILTDDAKVKYPTKNLLLLHKAEAFLNRRYLKCRDAFDIKLLIDSGAELGGNLKHHLEDGPASEHLENPEFILKRINAVTPRRCEAELKEYLPEDVFNGLANKNFQPLRDAVQGLFSDWLEQ